MSRTHGVGLAAPQIGKSLQIAVMEVKKNPKNKKILPLGKMAIINPKIVERSKKNELGWEGCLSLPGVRGKVPRSFRVVVEYYDVRGDKKKEMYTGLHARIFQHEIDHLHGYIYVDRIEDTTTIITEEEYQKRFVKRPKK